MVNLQLLLMLNRQKHKNAVALQKQSKAISILLWRKIRQRRIRLSCRNLLQCITELCIITAMPVRIVATNYYQNCVLVDCFKNITWTHQSNELQKRITRRTSHHPQFIRLDALALSVIATGTCLAGWVAGWVSVTLRYCITTAKPIWKLFRPSESPIMLVFWDPCADTKFQGKPHQRGR